jgi:hypothetical protein
MPNLSPEFAVQLLTLLATGAAIYGGIRADLRAMHQRLGRAEHDITEARMRMDNHIERSHV